MAPSPTNPSRATLLVRYRDGGDLELAAWVRGQARDLDGGRGGQVAAEILGPHAVEVVLLADVGEEARDGHQILKAAARGLQRLLEILHRQHGLLAHGGGQVELLLAVRMTVVDGGRGDAGEEDQGPTPHHDA